MQLKVYRFEDALMKMCLAYVHVLNQFMYILPIYRASTMSESKESELKELQIIQNRCINELGDTPTIYLYSCSGIFTINRNSNSWDSHFTSTYPNICIVSITFILWITLTYMVAQLEMKLKFTTKMWTYQGRNQRKVR